jgi:hypothetical protein
MMQPTDNRAMLNAANQASDSEYYGSSLSAGDNRAMLNAANRDLDPEYYGTDNRSVLNAVNRTVDSEYYGASSAGLSRAQEEPADLSRIDSKTTVLHSDSCISVVSFLATFGSQALRR